LNDSEIEKYFIKFKELADKKKEIYDADIVTIIGKELEDNNRVKFLNLEVSCGSKNSEARITLIFDSNEIELKTNGNGPVDAIFKAIRKLVPHKERLDLYQVHSVTHGTDAQADVTVRLENNNGKIYSGHGSDIDTLVASAKAYITALNKILNDEET